MAFTSIIFGTELRQRRTRAGLSLADLSALVHYSKSHLSKVETGGKRPSTDLARRCDAALGCEGALSALVAPPAPASAQAAAGVAPAEPDQDADEVWLLSLSTSDNDRFGTLSRRALLATGAAGLTAWAGLTGPPPAAAGPRIVAAFRSIFDQLRSLGQQVGAATLLPTLVAQTHALRRLGAAAAPAERAAILRLAARFAEYTGWMAQECGDDDRAIWWTDLAVRLAAEGGDPMMSAYASVRRALVTLYRHQAIQTVTLARAAEAASDHPRIRGLAAQREAQGHALNGDSYECHRALDRAASLLARAGTGTDAEPVLGTSHARDPATLARGWCLYDLGYPASAADVLQAEVDRLPATARRTRARFGARLSRAHASSGELDQACAALEPVLDTFEQIGSATIRLDLRAIAQTLNRWHQHRPLRETRLRLHQALNYGV